MLSFVTAMNSFDINTRIGSYEQTNLAKVNHDNMDYFVSYFTFIHIFRLFTVLQNALCTLSGEQMYVISRMMYICTFYSGIIHTFRNKL